jgi:putative colanic acid biosynthesis UDP-glucose lipid carrier transferase
LKNRHQKTVFFLGSKEGYKILKTWIEKSQKSQLHLNGWHHDKDIIIDPFHLLHKFDLITEDEVLDHFVIDSLRLDTKLFNASINWAESKGARIHLIQNSSSSLNKKLDKKNKFGPFIAVSLRREPLTRRYNQFRKKLLDYTISTIILLGVFWWLYPLVGILIKLSGRGPIVIHQGRIGIDGVQFNCMKFRTMVFEKPSMDGITYLTKKNDNRVTWIGKVLRKTNFDELPQFINVLMGDMSVVGPRPHMVNEDQDIADKIKKYRIRRFVKPGITGLAAIKGYRGGTNDLKLMQKRIDYDIKYIEQWSFWLDIKITIITFWKMITFDTKAH